MLSSKPPILFCRRLYRGLWVFRNRHQGLKCQTLSFLLLLLIATSFKKYSVIHLKIIAINMPLELSPMLEEDIDAFGILDELSMEKW